MRVPRREGVRGYFLPRGLVLSPKRRQLAEMGGGDTRPRVALQPPNRCCLRPPPIAWRRAIARGVHHARARFLQLEHAALFALTHQHRKAQTSEGAGAFELVGDVEDITAFTRVGRLELL